MNSSTDEIADRAQGQVASDTQNALALLATRDLSDSRYYREGCRIIAKHFQSPYACARVSLGHGNIDQTWSQSKEITERFGAHVEVLLLECQSGGRSTTRIVGGDGDASTAIMAVPVADSLQHASGALALVDGDASDGSEDTRLWELRSLVAALDANAPSLKKRKREGADFSEQTTSAVSKAAAYKNLHEFAFALTNNLRVRTQCDQVALGVSKRRRIKLLSISGVDDPNPKQPGTQRMRQAMEECLDAGDPIFHQDDDRWDDEPLSTGHLLHKQWHEDAGGAAVASLPLRVGETVVGVVALRRPAGKCFTREEATTIGPLVEPYGAAMALMKRASRGLFAHALGNVYSAVRWLGSPADVRRKTFVAALVAFALWFAFGTMTYVVPLPATIAPLSVRHYVSPFAGTISEGLVKAGDRVEAGQVLYRFDTAELELKRSEVVSELAAKQIEIDQAIAVGDRAAATLAKADIAVLEAQLATAEHRLGQATGRAQVAGTILRGDLAQKVGQVVPQGELLYEIIPDRAFRLELDVGEDSLREIVVDQRGVFNAVARPETDVPLKIDHVRPSAEIRREKNVFVAEASIAPGHQEAWMRTAMDGVVRIEVGERRVWWVALHKVIDYARLRLWL